VEIDAGTSGHGNLNIESLQDSSNTKSKQQGFGASVSVGAGKMNGSVNLSHSRVEGEFASVNEQSGMRAGDEGFQVRVAGNTDLKGGKIASTDKAASEGKNSLSTETLTQSDIRNRSSYKAESISVGAGLDGAKGSLAGTGIGIGSSSGNESSVTRSGISAADVRIKDDLAQQAKTGKSAAETIASINTDVSSERDTSGKLNKQWDAQALQEDVQAQARIMEAFGRNASREIGRYATTKVNELDRKIESASEAERPALIAERDKWSEGGLYRTALHTAAGALSGGAAGGAGALTASTVMPEFGKLIDKMALSAPVRQGLEQVTAAAIGSVVGGSAGLAAAVNADANNRQLHQSERDWAKSQASKYRKYLKDATRESISDEEAYQRLLSAGYAVVDAAAERGGKSDELAKRFIAENKTAGLFSASAAERNDPFLNGNKDGSWTPEQQARYGLRNPSEWVDFRIDQALIFTRRTCLSASECGAKVTNITLAVAALEQKKALYWDEPLIRREIDAQKSSLVNGITAQDIQRAKLAEADRNTLLELLAVADAPVLVGKIGELISHSGRRTQPSIEQVSTSLAEANSASGERLLQHLARSQKSDPLIGMVISVGREPVTVTAEANIGGKIILDTNQTARALDKADPTKRTLISDLIPSEQPNSNMANAHAEIAVIQKGI
jgi:filamentous hemagglutinin